MWHSFVLILLILTSIANTMGFFYLVEGSCQTIPSFADELTGTFRKPAPVKDQELLPDTSNFIRIKPLIQNSYENTIAAAPSQSASPPYTRNDGNRLKPMGKTVTFGFQKGNLYAEFPLREVSREDDDAYWNQPGDINKSMTKRREQLKQEDELYGRYMGRAADNITINGYFLGANLPTFRQNCGGLVMARLLRAPYQFPTNEAYKFVYQFGDPYGGKRQNDLGVFFRKVGEPSHFIIYDTGGLIYSKDDEQSVFRGTVEGYKAVADSRYGYNDYHSFHMDWDHIKAYRKGSVQIQVEEADNPNQKVEDARVDLIPREPVGNPPTEIWRSKNTDRSGNALFTGSDQFPFDVSKYNLRVKVTYPLLYQVETMEQKSGPYFPDDTLRLVVRLKNKMDEPWRKLLGRWRSSSGAEFVITGANGSFSAKVDKRSETYVKERVPPNATWFTGGSITSNTPLVVESRNFWAWPYGSKCPALQPHTTGQIKLTLHQQSGTRAATLNVEDRAPNHDFNTCNWYKDDVVHTSTWTKIRD